MLKDADPQPNVDGVFVLNKPAGPTSHDMVLRLRRKLPGHRVGHIGTLDPFATGVLPLCVGNATRLAQYLGHGEKVYEGMVRFGWATDTGDLTGKALNEPVPVTLTVGRLEPILERFRGEILQRAPIFSARKVQGIPLYRYARQGNPMNAESKKVIIHELELTEVQGCRCGLRIRCSPGTYIRSIAMELGDIVGCGAHLESLKRVEAGEFSIDQSFRADCLNPESSTSELLSHRIPMESLLAAHPKILLSAESFRRVANGSPIAVAAEEIRFSLAASEAPGVLPIRLFSPEGQLAALGRIGPAPAFISVPLHAGAPQSLWVHPVAVFA